MAIDSIDKRKSAAWTSMYVAPSVEPDNTQPQEWRQTTGFGYYGITVTGSGTTIVVSTGIEFSLTMAQAIGKEQGISEGVEFALAEGTGVAAEAQPLVVGTFTTYQAVGVHEHLGPGAKRVRRSHMPDVPNTDEEVE